MILIFIFSLSKYSFAVPLKSKVLLLKFHQWINNKEFKNILVKYYKGEEITESDNKLLKTIITDNLKIINNKIQ